MADDRSESTITNRKAVVLWCAAVVAGAATISLIIALAPARLRLLGALAAGQGGACGFAFVRMARTLNAPIGRVNVLFGFVAGAASFLLTCGIWWNSYRAEVAAQFKSAQQGAGIAQQMLSQFSASDPVGDSPEEREFRKGLEAAADAGRKQLDRDRLFSSWLKHRVSSVTSSEGAGFILFAIELVAAGLPGAFLLLRQSNRPYCATCGTWQRPIREQIFQTESAPEVARLLGLDGGGTSIDVRLSNCVCDGRRPDVFASAVDKSTGRVLATMTAPLAISEDAFKALVAKMDAAQGMG